MLPHRTVADDLKQRAAVTVEESKKWREAMRALDKTPEAKTNFETFLGLVLRKGTAPSEKGLTQLQYDTRKAAGAVERMERFKTTALGVGVPEYIQTLACTLSTVAEGIRKASTVTSDQLIDEGICNTLPAWLRLILSV
jgi:hypothetical protein